jgi:hypothetical protein
MRRRNLLDADFCSHLREPSAKRRGRIRQYAQVSNKAADPARSAHRHRPCRTRCTRAQRVGDRTAAPCASVSRSQLRRRASSPPLRGIARGRIGADSDVQWEVVIRTLTRAGFQGAASQQTIQLERLTALIGHPMQSSPLNGIAWDGILKRSVETSCFILK